MKKKNVLLIVGALLALLCAIAVLARLNAPAGDVQTGEITVVRDGQTLAVFTMEDIAALPYVEVEKEIVSSSFENTSGLYRGVPLRTLLEAAEKELLADASQVIVSAEDGFVCAYDAEEVAQGDGILLVYLKDGAGLGTLADGGEGPFRILAVDDPFGNRSCKYVCSVEVG